MSFWPKSTCRGLCPHARVETAGPDILMTGLSATRYSLRFFGRNRERWMGGNLHRSTPMQVITDVKVARLNENCGLAWAREQEYQISASCWYVKKFLR